MSVTVLRKELHTMIDTMPDQFIKAIVPLVSYIADDYWKPVIEPADAEESVMIEERAKEYDTNRESWVSIKDIG